MATSVYSDDDRKPKRITKNVRVMSVNGSLNIHVNVVVIRLHQTISFSNIDLMYGYSWYRIAVSV